MIGKFIKDPSNKIFEGKNEEYMLSQNLIDSKGNRKIINLLGTVLYFINTYLNLIIFQLVANSIVNGQIMGVTFSNAFMKAIFNSDVSFEDMVNVFDKQTFSNYKMMRTV